MVELAEGHQPEAIVLDPGLPAKPGGRVVARHARPTPPAPSRSILVSGETEEAARQLFNEASVTGMPTLLKPLDIGAHFVALKRAVADRAVARARVPLV